MYKDSRGEPVPVTFRIIDPNKGKAPSGVGVDGTLYQEFEKHGMYFYPYVNDDITSGHMMVAKYLHYDKSKPIDRIGNSPKLFFMDNCNLAIRGMTHYVWDEYRNKDSKDPKEKPKDKFKDAPDCVRYLCMVEPKYKDTSEPYIYAGNKGGY